MKTRTALIALATLAAGSAFAQMPAAGEGPLFLNEAKFVSSTPRDAVRPQAQVQFPASGEQNDTALAQSAQDSGVHPTRAEVREATRQAIANGQRPAVGDRS